MTPPVRLRLLGDPVGQSLSPAMHAAALATLKVNGMYDSLRVDAAELSRAVDDAIRLGFTGLNVTIPHKEAAAGLVDELSMEARELGAVNAIHFFGDRLVGYNTDAFAVARALSARSARPRRALVLGAGGAARAAAHALGRAGAEVVVANRTRGRADAVVTMLRSCGIEARAVGLDAAPEIARVSDVVLNATSVGLGTDASPLPSPSPMRPGALALDMVYRPLETAFLRDARTAGAHVVDGLELLVWQGLRSLEIWLGRTLDPSLADVMRAAALEAM